MTDQQNLSIPLSEATYQELIEHSNSIILRIDTQGRLTYANLFAENFFGYGRGELIGRPVVGTLVPPTDQFGQDLAEMMADILVNPNKYASNENENTRQNGDRVWISWSNQPITDSTGRLVEVLCIGNDISRRKRAEEALREAEARFRSIFENSVEGMFQTTPAGQYLRANAALAHLYGYDSPEELVKTITNIERQLYVDPNRRGDFMRFIQERGQVHGFEAEIYRQDGSTIWISETARMVEENGSVAFYEGTVTDITQRKQIEAEILQHNVQLAAFNRVAIALTAATEIKAALGEVTREIVLLFKASYGSLALLTPDKMGLELIASHAIGEQPPLEPSIIPLESNLVIQQVVKSGQGLMVNEAPPNPPNESLRNWRHSINGHSLLVVPLIVRGHVIGTLSLNRRQPEREFSAAEFSLAETLAGQVSGAVENFRLLDEARHRSNSLQTAAEVSQAANSILDVNDLIHTSVNLIRDEYDFYYVGMFLVDERREWAVLQTGTGEAGKVQLAKGHKLKIGGASMIGWCIEHRQARIALDVGVEAVRFNNPHLPETRSEMALPLISRDEVIGALTVQSTRPAAFTAEDVTLLQTMADQLANAIANARLFESAAAARSEAEERLQETLALQELSQALSGSLAQEQILQLFFQACTSRIGFEYVQLSLVELGQNRVRALAGVGMPEQQLQNSVHSLDANTIAVDIIRTGRTEIISGWDERVDRVGLEADTPRAGVRVFTPITLRRENIGLVEAGFNSNVSPSISAPQVRLLQAFVVQTALALDNARRYEASQRMAEREALTKEIINKIRASNELGIILATTVQEIGRAIGSKRAVIQIDAPAGNSGFGVGAQGNPPSSGGIGYVFSDSGLSLLEAPLERESGQSLSAPIQIQGQTLGQIRLDDPERDYWSIEDISLLEEISSQVALAIDHALVLDQSRERSRELSILFDATRQLTETIDLQQIYTILARQVTDYLNGDRCTVLALNPARTHFEAIVEKSRDLDGRLADRPTSTKVALDDAPSLSTILKKPQALVHHFDDPDLDAPTRQRMAGDPVPFQTTASFPLLARDRGVGVLEVAHLKPHPYSQNELQLVQAIVGQVAVAIENAQLFQQTQVALADTQRLFEISTALVESSSVDDVFETIIETVRSYEVDRVSISLFDKTQSGEIVTVTIVSTWDQDESKRLPVGTKFSADSFSLVHAFAQPPFHPLISHDLRRPEGQDPRMDDEFRTYVVREFEAVTLFSAPMFLGSEYKGVMSIYTRKPHLYTDQEIRIYQTLADQAIIAIENYRLLEQTRAERDRASLLYEVGQALNRPVNVEDVEDILLSFTPKIGATHTEIYITDGESLFSGASTVPSRQDMAPKMLAELAFSQGPESSILGHGTKLVRIRRAGHGPWPLANLPDMQTLVCIPFRSTRSTLHGVLTFLHSEPDGFSPEQMAVFEAMAQQTAATLENVWLLQQTRRVLDETEVLYRATRRFNSAQKVDDLLHTLVSSFSQTIPQLDSMLLATVPLTPNNRAPDFCQVVAAWERAGDGIREADFKLARTRFSFMNDLRFDSPLEVAYHQLTPDVKAAVDEQLFGLRSLLLVPMVVGPEWVGLLLVGSRTDGYMFELPAQNQIVTLAGQAAVIIQNLQLVAETQKNLFHTEILSNLGHQLLATDLAEVMYDLAVSAVAATEPDRGAVSAVIKRGGDTVELEMVAWWDTPGQDWMASLADLPRYEPIAEVIGHFDGNQALVINQTDAGECFSPELHHLLSETMQICDAVVVPLWYNRCVQGIILIASHSQKFFKTDTLRLYEDIARETSGALENRRLFDEVEGRARQLATAAEVSQAATAYLDLDTLLSKAVDLIKERFNFYHVSIFLVDEYQKFAVVHAATDQVGREMLAKGYRLPVGGQSIVGIATASGKPRVVQNIKDDVRTTVNLLLPHIRSEMALPLTVQGRVIGALDVKSTELGAFDESDITILMSMANQLANAIQAARAVEEANQAVAEINKLHQHYLQAEWVTFFRGQQPAIRYSLAESGDLVEAESDPLSLMQAAQFKRPTLIAGEPAGSAERPSAEPVNGAGLTDDSPTANNPLTLVAPLILNGQAMIGSLEFALDRARGAAVDDDTLHIVEAVANQAAQAIEAARLFEETQISREEAEALYEVGRLLIATEDEQEMFNAVLGKMLGVMGLVQGGVLLFDEDRVLGRLYALYRGGRPVEPDLVFPIKGNPSYELLIKSKQPVAIEDMATDPLVEPVRALNLASGLKSLLLVPIIINDEVIGALGADSVDKKHIFTEREKNLAAAMADQLAISLLNRRLFKEQQETAKRLKEIDKLKTQFLANMSHELRTPLNSIIGFSRVILKGIDGPLTELQKADLTSIHNSGHHLLGLINNILDLSKIEAGRMELNFETVEIEPVVKTVMSTAIALVKDKRVELVRQLPPALPTIQADPTRLRQIILNLVSNACKFTEQGTVTLAVQADQEHVIFSVIDTGIGISEEQMSSIFEEFTQVDGSTTRKAGGTGLGLPISRHFAELHGGEIWVTSTPGQGSTFSFSIPIRLPERETKADQGVENVVAPSHKRSILIIDNDPQVVALYERFLSGGDFEVNTVDLKQDIIAQVKAFHPYVILLDVILTGWDGWGLLKTLKDNSFTKDIPVIVCSIAGDKNRGFSLGASAYLIKPITETELIEALKTVEAQRQRDEVRVLIVDDKADDVLLIRRMLEVQANYNISEASNGKEGLELIKLKRPDLIILDLNMPEMDGFAMMEELKENEHTRSIPIIVVSADELSAENYDRLSGQVEVLLRKGIFTELELLEDVSKALGQRQEVML